VVAGSVRIEPDAMVGRVEDSVLVSFAVSEALEFEPRVVLGTPAPRPLTLEAREGLTYRFVYSPGRDEPEEEIQLTATLVDTGGNLSADLALGSLTFDLTPPSVDEVRVEGRQHLGAEGRATILVRASEPLAGPPEVLLDDGPGTFDVTGQGDVSSLREYRLVYSVQDDDAQGSHFLTIRLRDLAGNEGTHTTGERLVFDSGPPEVEGEPSIINARAREGEVVGVGFALSEALGVGPEVLLVPMRAAGAPQQASIRLARTELSEAPYPNWYTHTVEPGQDGEYRLEILGFEDLAGNEGVPWRAPQPVLVDTRVPELVNATVRTVPEVRVGEGAARLVVGDGAALQVTLDVREEGGLAQHSPRVLLDTSPLPLPLPPVDRDAPCRPLEDGLAHWRCEYELMLTRGEHEGLDGIWPLRLELEDTAGNRSTESSPGGTPVRLDFIPPSLAFRQVAPSPAAAGLPVTITVTFQEELGEAPYLALDPPLPGGPEGTPRLTTGYDPDRPTSFAFGYDTPGEGSDSEHRVTVHATDLAGNAVEVDLGDTLVLDLTRPRISSLQVTTPSAEGYVSLADCRHPDPAHGQVVVTFEVDDVLTGRPVVRIGPHVAPCVERGEQAYECVYQLSGCEGEDRQQWPETEGALPVSVTVLDDAGNSATAASEEPLVFDLTPPAVVEGSASVQLIPDRDNPLQEVGAANRSTRVYVTFSLTEPLRTDSDGHDDPAPRVVMSGTGVQLEKVSQAGMLYTYEGRLDEVGPGLRTEEQLRIVAGPDAIHDRAGNAPSDALVVAAFVVDTDPPGAPATEPEPGGAPKIVYTRIPWGAERTGGESTYCVSGLAGAVEPGVSVHIYDGPDPSTAALLGHGQADDDGAFGVPGCAAGEPGGLDPLLLGHGPRAGVYVAAIDEAGNFDLAQVGEIEWVATINGKVAGSALENPHVLEDRAVWAGGRLRSDAIDAGDVPIVTQGGGAVWHNRTQAVSPSARHSHNMAYDSRRGRVVVFGGANWDHGCDEGTGDYCGYTWEFDGATWARMPSQDPEGDGDPLPRKTALMAFDAARGVTVLAGGENNGGCGEDLGSLCRHVWEWNGVNWKRRPLRDPEGDGDPDIRSHSAMAHDAFRGRTVLFGASGCGDEGVGGHCGHTWEWNGASWRRMHPVDPEGDGAPAPRLGHAMAYDATSEVVYLYGGRHPADDCGEGSGAYCGWIWAWDGTSWMRVGRDLPPGDSPPARADHSLAYDESRGVLVLFGGSLGAGEDGGDCGEGHGPLCARTWEWDGLSWSSPQRGDPEHAEVPRPREGPGMVYDADDECVAMFGGHGAEAVCGEGADWNCGTYWCYDEAGWRVSHRNRPDNGDPHPAPRRFPAMTFDSDRSRVVLFGGGNHNQQCGEGASDPGLCRYTWERDGRAWERMTPSDPEGDGDPSARWSTAMVYDTTRQVTLLFSGEWMDDVVQEESGHLWAWNGLSWRLLPPEDPEGDGNPNPRYLHHMVYDERRDRVVLFGGQQRADVGCGEPAGEGCAYTWEWNGSSWLRVAPEDPQSDGDPDAFSYEYAMAYDRNPDLLTYPHVT